MSRRAVRGLRARWRKGVIAVLVLPGVMGKLASAALDTTLASAARPGRTVRVDGSDGKQSLIRLPEKLFTHSALELKDRQSAAPAAPAPDPSPRAPGVPVRRRRADRKARTAPRPRSSDGRRVREQEDRVALASLTWAARGEGVRRCAGLKLDRVGRSNNAIFFDRDARVVARLVVGAVGSRPDSWHYRVLSSMSGPSRRAPLRDCFRRNSFTHLLVSCVFPGERRSERSRARAGARRSGSS